MIETCFLLLAFVSMSLKVMTTLNQVSTNLFQESESEMSFLLPQKPSAAEPVIMSFVAGISYESMILKRYMWNRKTAKHGKLPDICQNYWQKTE